MKFVSRPFVANHRTILGGILLAGLVLRLALVSYVSSYPERYIQSDGVGYNQIAINLIAGRGFSKEATAPFVPDNFRTPIYPFTVALCYAVLGYHPAIVLWLQCLMGALTVLTVYFIGKLTGGSKAGLIAAAFLAISPSNINYSAVLWSDTEFTFFLALSTLLTAIMFSRLELRWVFWSSLMAGIATLTHPRSLYLPFFLAPVLLANRLMRRCAARQALLITSLYLIIYNLVLFPWMTRNYIVFGVPNLTSAAGINMLDYGAALTEAAQTGEDQWSVAARYDAEVTDMGPAPLNEAEFSEAALGLALRKIAQSPLVYAKVHIIGMAKTLLPGTFMINNLLTGQASLDVAHIYGAFIGRPLGQPFPYIQALREIPVNVWSYIGFELLYLGCIYLLSLYVIVAKRQSWPWSRFFAVIIFYLAAVAGPAGAPRFRVAMMPVFSVLAACGLTGIWSLIAKTGSGFIAPSRDMHCPNATADHG